MKLLWVGLSGIALAIVAVVLWFGFRPAGVPPTATDEVPGFDYKEVFSGESTLAALRGQSIKQSCIFDFQFSAYSGSASGFVDGNSVRVDGYKTDESGNATSTHLLVVNDRMYQWSSSTVAITDAITLPVPPIDPSFIFLSGITLADEVSYICEPVDNIPESAFVPPPSINFKEFPIPKKPEAEPMVAE